jgi:hypothetical protein
MVAEIVDLDDSGYVDFQAAVWVSWEQERRVLVRREKFFHVFFSMCWWVSQLFGGKNGKT